MKIKSAIFLILFSLITVWSFAQSTTSRSVRTKDFVEEINFLENNGRIKLNTQKMYHWVEAGVLYKTQAGYKGRLLHGEYIKTDHEGNLIEKGKFRKGLKSGQWNIWDKKGKLIHTSNWKNGLLHGLTKEFDKGNLRAVIPYKNNLKHGKEWQAVEKEMVVVGEFKKGQLVIDKSESKIKGFFKNNKTEEIDSSENDSSEDEMKTIESKKATKKKVETNEEHKKPVIKKE